MSRPKNKYEKKKYESDCSNSDISANIYESMLKSYAWCELSASQKVLYLYCKSQRYSEKNHPNGNDVQFFMNKAKWQTRYKLYKLGNEKGFYRDMTELIEKGFVSCIESGANTRTKNIYQFSSKWQIYGKPEFSISDSEKTISMQGFKKKGKKPP